MFVIYSTPGLIEEGSYMLSADGIRRGEIEPGYVSADGPAVGLYHSEKAAEAAMMALVPEGSTPAVYAGLRVDAAGPLAQQHTDLCEWMD